MSVEKTKATVSIIGAGRLGTALAMALTEAGYQILGLVAKRINSAEAAAEKVGSSPLALSADELHRLPPSQIVLITTPDDVLPDIVRELGALRVLPEGSVVLHTSGALSSKLLSALADAGQHTGSLHPLVSVSQAREGAASFRGSFFCIEGDETARETAAAIVSDLGGETFSIDSEKKALYHAAAVTTAGHVIALFDVATEMLTQCGLDLVAARKVLTPLIKSAVKNLEQASPEEALTGTFSRGDLATVIEHLKALGQTDLETAKLVYRILGLQSLVLAERRGMNAELVEEIAQHLISADEMTSATKG
jgi:predicted short-subunit dehydrogenase-like oxidoreductase (DUF2520 family)